MNVNELLNYLAEQEVKLWVEGDQLRYRARAKVMTSDLRQELVEHKADLIKLLRSWNGAPSSDHGLGRTVARPEGAIPLSFAQQRLWFLDQLVPQNPFYNVPVACRLIGLLHMQALERSAQELVRRHESLRTTFVVSDGLPRQMILPLSVLPKHFLLVVDLTRLSMAEQETISDDLARQEARHPFDLSRELLLRASVLRLAGQEHVLLLTMHHIACDSWSGGVLNHELSMLYVAFAAGEPSPLPALPVQYADFAFWQCDRLQGIVLEQLLVYWREQLANLPTLNLPSDFVRPAVGTFRGNHIEQQLAPRLLTHLKKLSQREGVTLFMTLLAAFQVLLMHYCNQEDVVVGVPVADRHQEELEGLIGFFVNTLVLRTDLSGNPTFQEVLRRVREVTLGAYAHQDLPFERLVEALQPERHLAYNPLCQVLFELHNVSQHLPVLPGLTTYAFGTENRTAKFDLSLLCSETGETLTCLWEYNTDLFVPETIERMHTHFQLVLQQLVESTTQHIHQQGLLTASERQQMLVEWNDASIDDSGEQTITSCFDTQVERTPDAIAVHFEDQQYSYRWMQIYANRLAHYLQQQGVGSEMLVGVCLQRSVHMVVALLAILKAGGTYVPLDSNYPDERLKFLLADSQARLVLTHTVLHARLASLAFSVPLLCLEMLSLEPGLSTLPLPTPAVAADHLAYVIYTSGSTGVPKGVSLTHRNALALLTWARSFFTAHEGNGVLASTSICFDLSIFELFGPLSWGGTIVLVENLLQLGEQLLAERVTLVNTVPSVLTAYLQLHRLLPSVCMVNLAGEALPRRLVQQVYAHESIEQVCNLYGPSEDATYSLGVRLRREEEGVVPIGHPLGGRRAYVLDGWGQPVPIGVVGELYLEGQGLARGYWQRADLTAERFVPDGWSGQAGGRLYRTGDLVRYRADGQVEYIGRGDGQVKLRGYRIELGEIEAVLAQHPAVQQNVVLLREDHARDKQLVAYIVVHPDHSLAPGQIRGYVQDFLPDYMVPNVFIVLPAFPLTSNGKLDRQALPIPGTMPLEGEQRYVAPQTPIEEIVAAIWEQVLRLEQVSTSENFFALGGHSLLATQVIARIQTALQIMLPLRALFEHPTIAALAHHIEAIHHGAATRPTLRPRSQQTLLPLSFAQQRLWFLDQLVPQNPFYNMPLALHLEGPLHVSALERGVQELVRRHESLRTTFVIHEDQPGQVILPLTELPEHFLVMVNLEALTHLEQEEVSRHLATQEALRPFYLSSDLVLRSCVLRLGEQKHVLLLTLHHIACDGWSLGVLSRELGALYQAFVAGDPSPLAPLPVQYADFACWQRGWLRGEVLEQQLTYWQQRLADLPTLNLPIDFTRPQMETFSGAHITQRLPAPLLAQLKRLSQQEEVTLFMTLLAAFQVLLMRYSEQEDIVVGAPTANRTQQELEGLIGFFVNTLVLRTDLSGNPTFKELLVRVREVTLGAYTHEDVPFERLVEALQPERNLAYNPLCQVVFQLQHTPQQSLTLPGLVVEQRWADNQTAKIDLALFCVEEEEHLACRWEYSTDLFAAATIERMSRHFQNVLTALLADPGQHVRQLNLLSAAERQQLLVEWNPPPRPAPPEAGLIQCFEAQVRHRPEAIAVVFEQEQLTYQVLNQRANQLAHYLQGLGVGPEVLVGVGLERSLDLIVALLGILKAGGAYLPLDPGYPAQRLAFIMQDAQVSILLTHTALGAQFSHDATRVLFLDAEWPLIAQSPDSNPQSSIQPHHLAYVIYTSGSTGQPKGVLIPHQGLHNLVQIQQSIFAVHCDSHIIQFASSSFDASIWEMMVALFWGASLYLAPRPSFALGSSLERVLQTYAISIAAFPPGTLATLEPEQVPELRTVLSFGEECPESLAVKWSRDRAFFNGYGPTETTICTTMTNEYTSTEKLTIGRPIANVQVYIFDQHLHLVPVGVPGEMYIGGAGLARGYLHRPELTAQRFIPHPFSTQAGACLYKTGDLARYRPDGSIEFLGRVDQQVKLRGFRIELGEIEAALMQHPLVQDAVVTLRQEQGDKRLVAYVVPAATRAWEAEEIRQEETTGLMRREEQEREQVVRWQELYAQTYQNLDPGSDPTFNIRGWNSSYTGQPLPKEEMRGWLEDTLGSIRHLQPRCVLEIGCGTGLLLFSLAPDCISYDASDFSAPSLAYVQQVIEQDPARYSAVQLWQRLADDFQGWEQERYDVVILNSVVQYFPDVSYLLRVLQGALNLLSPGGTLFVGDVRSLPLLEHFQLAVRLAQGSEGLSRQQVRQQVQRGRQLEEELLVDPALFVALGQQEERIGQVRILPKRSVAHNELSQFRYQVLVRVCGQEAEETEQEELPAWQEWQSSYESLEQLREELQRERPAVLRLSHIPNARLSQVLEAHYWLWQEQEPAVRTLGALRQRLEARGRQGVELVELEAMCVELGYQLQVSWARQAEEGSYDVVLIHTRNAPAFSRRQIVSSFPLPSIQPGSPWQIYTNRPLEGQRMRQLVPLLRQHMQERLPDYMVPAYLLLLERLPLTPNGKVDRRALPLPEGEVRLGLKAAYVAPRTEVEQQMAEIWMRVLGLPKVGVHDDFFALGGHSLLATQVIARVQTAWQITVPLRTLFEYPTVESLSRILVDYELVPGQIEMIARLHKEIDRMSSEEIEAFLRG